MQYLKRNLFLSLFLAVIFFFSSEFVLNSFIKPVQTGDQERKLHQLTVSQPSPIAHPKVRIIFTGDVMLGRKVMIHSLDDKKVPKYPFLEVADYLRSADLVFINLENPIITDCPQIESGFKFCADPVMMEGLTYAGVDVVTLANNHTTNFGLDGLRQTVEYLNSVGIEATGVGNLVVKELVGTKFGFLGFDFVSKSPRDEEFELVEQSRSQVDVLIVGVHWGEEYKAIANSFQRQWAQRLVEAGADVVVGHHPHWVQDDECLEDVSRYADIKPYPVWKTDTECKTGSKRIYYSLGNFIFDQMWSEETKRSMTVKLTFQEGNIIGEERRFTYMPEWAKTVFVE